MVKNIQGTNIKVYIEDKKFKLPEDGKKYSRY